MNVFGLAIQELNNGEIYGTFFNVRQASSQVGAAGSDPLLDKLSSFKDSFWRFLRPHTIRGTALGSV